ncbi:MAG: SLC13 family permease, partial [Planctomycetia bacterium]|nr:SLC13 family permease [Planctomycetia bacterium]
MILDPLLILFFGLVTVIVLIVCLRVNAFIALLAAALVVCFCSPLESVTTSALKSEVSVLSAKVDLVAKAFGDMAGRIGILLAFGAIIGTCMSESGAADRIVRQICHTLGPKRVPQALLGSGFILSIPVFYDVTFYLLLPLAKSVY